MAVRCYREVPADPRTWPARRQLTKQLTARSPRLPSGTRGFFMPPDPADANGDLPMTEQMTGRNGPEGTERPGALRAPGGTTPQSPGTGGSTPPSPPGPPAVAAAPSAPSPRDLAARSPHHPAAREGQPRPAEGPLPAPSQVAGSVPPQAAAA